MDIKIPSIGESITEGTIARWLKQDGDSVTQGETLFELETEKATTEIPAPASGVLHITAGEGKTVPIGAVVGAIAPGDAPAAPAPKTEAKRRPAGPEPKKTEPAAAKPKPAAAPEPEKPAAGRDGPHLSPAARRLAAEEGLEPGAIPASGRGGLVTKEDVLQQIEKQRAPEAPAAPATPPTPPPVVPAHAANRETRQPLSAIRQRIAERLLNSQRNAATLTTFNEADLSAVMDLRARHKDRFRERHGVGLGFMSFFVKAAVEALRTYPIVNAWIDQNEIVYHNYHNIGVAVSTEKGLMVPVLRDADRLSFADIEKSIAELADKARAGKISVPDLQDGTFTITNGGVFGSLLSTPILNPPQSAILGMHTIQKRPVVVNDELVIRPMMYLALSYDHRLIDGRDAVLFLARVKECVENPERLLLEI